MNGDGGDIVFILLPFNSVSDFGRGLPECDRALSDFERGVSFFGKGVSELGRGIVLGKSF